MIVRLVASTTVDSTFYQRIGETEMGARERTIDLSGGVPGPAWVGDSELLAEAAGRVCYDSFDLPNPATRENVDYLANIRKQQHFSVLEHATFTFHVEGVSRALLAELTRHRHLSFSVRSQRYCDEADSLTVIPDALLGDEYRDIQRAILDRHGTARVLYRDIVDRLVSNGAKRKEAHDAARYVLPEGTCTEFYVTGNARAWLEFLDKRDSPHAAEEIRMLAQQVRELLADDAPNVFTST